MTTGIARLRELAQRATPGPWQESDGIVFMSGSAYFEVAENATRPDSAFIAAANPAVVLALLDVVEAAKATVTEDDYALSAALADLTEALSGE